jgi:sortase A
VRLAKVLNAIGRTSITAGVLILLFVAYQLWGTGIRERQAQDRLERKFREQQAALQDNGTIATSSSSGSASTSSDTVTTETLPVTTAPSEGISVVEGEPIGQIKIPKIGLDAYVVEGVGDNDLHQGPGHYPSTPLPGQAGNASIAGHRTTYGAPFGSINELSPNDSITVTTLQGSFLYKVVDCDKLDKLLDAHRGLHCDVGSGQIIVSPSASFVLEDLGFNALTLTACHPKYSASERIIVFAELSGEPKPQLPHQVAARDAPKASLSVSGESAPKLPVILFALLCAAIWIVAWQIGKRWRKWPSYFIGLPFFLVALFYFFENFSRLLPPNY